MNNHDEETEEEHAVRLRKISEEVKADIKAGRYANGQIHPHIYGSYKLKGSVTGRLERENSIDHFFKMYEGLLEAKTVDEYVTLDSIYHHRLLPRMERSRRYDHVILDECHHIDPATYWTSKYREPKEKDWERKTFKSGGPTTPSEAVRLKRRAERKAKKK